MSEKYVIEKGIPTNKFYPIEKGIPYPTTKARKNRYKGYPFRFMEVGDSFQFETCLYNNVRPMACRMAKILGTTYKFHFYDNGLARIWRVE